MNGLLKRLKEERIQGSSAVLNYSNFDYWVNWDDIVDIVEDHDQPQLNENQQIVLDWLKEQYFTGYGPAVIRTIHLLQRENTIDVSGSKPVIEAYRALDTAGEAMVVKLFVDWAKEREEEK